MYKQSNQNIEFYRKYNLSYWTNKIALLYNSFENYNKAKTILLDGIDSPDDTDFLLMLKIEIHFFYYQIVESLFELIFALDGKSEENIWETISFSKFSTYKRIKNISTGKDDIFNKVINLINQNNSKEPKDFPFLQYVFFRHVDFNKVENDLSKNLENIKKLLSIMISDFSNRDEYNAFKHSLRFVLEKPYVAFSPVTDGKLFEFTSKEGFGYLVQSKKDKILKIEKVIKSFTTDKDIKLIVYISWLINNLIATRRLKYFQTQENIMFLDTIPIDNIFEEVGELAEIRKAKYISLND